MPLNDNVSRWYHILRLILFLAALLYALGNVVAVTKAETLGPDNRERLAVLERNVAEVERRVQRIESMSVDIRLDRLERSQENFLRLQEQQRHLVFGLYVPLLVLSADVLFRFYLHRKSLGK